MTKSQTNAPVFCDNCSSLAVAIVDGAPLCMQCLTAMLHQNAKSQNDISPLHLKAYRLPTPVHLPPKNPDKN